MWEVAMTTKSSNPSPSLSKMGREGGDAAIKDNVFIILDPFSKTMGAPFPTGNSENVPREGSEGESVLPLSRPSSV